MGAGRSQHNPRLDPRDHPGRDLCHFHAGIYDLNPTLGGVVSVEHRTAANRADFRGKHVGSRSRSQRNSLGRGPDSQVERAHLGSLWQRMLPILAGR